MELGKSEASGYVHLDFSRGLVLFHPPRFHNPEWADIRQKLGFRGLWGGGW